MSAPTPIEKTWTAFLVDDHRYMRSLLRGMLNQMGVKSFEEFDDCTSCLARLRGAEAAPDFILLDWHMQGMDGYAFCQEVRLDKTIRSKGIPIVLVTGEQDPMLLEQMRDLGVKAVLNKPVALPELQAAVYKAVGIAAPVALRKPGE